MKRLNPNLILACILLFLLRLLVGSIGDIIPRADSQKAAKVDTIYTVERDTVIIEGKAKIKYTSKHDTIYRTKAFVAELDTSIEKRIWKATFHYPENTFKIEGQWLDTSRKEIYPIPECQARSHDIGVGLLGGTALGLAISIIIDN